MDTRIVILLAASALLVVSLVYLLITLLSGRRARRRVLTAPAIQLAPAEELPEATEALRTPLRLGDWEPADAEDLEVAGDASPAVLVDEAPDAAEAGFGGAESSAAPIDRRILEDDLEARLADLALEPAVAYEGVVAESATQATTGAGPGPTHEDAERELEGLLAPLEADAGWPSDVVAAPAAGLPAIEPTRAATFGAELLPSPEGWPGEAEPTDAAHPAGDLVGEGPTDAAAALAPGSEWLPPLEAALADAEPGPHDEVMATEPAFELELEPVTGSETVAGLEPVIGSETGAELEPTPPLEYPIPAAAEPTPPVAVESTPDAVALPDAAILPVAFPESSPVPAFDAEAMGTVLEDADSALTTASEPVAAREASAEMPLSALLAELEPAPAPAPEPAASVEPEPPAQPFWAAPLVAAVPAWEPAPATEPHPWESPVPPLEPLLAEGPVAPVPSSAPEPAPAPPEAQPALSPGHAHEAPEYRLVAPVELSFADGDRKIGIRPGTATFLKYQRLAAVLLNDLKKSRGI